MLKESKKRKLKVAMSVFLIFSIVFQSVPVKANAFDLQGFINKIMKKINMPDELKLEDNGDLFLGKWRLAKCVSKKDINGDGVKECTNPFNGMTLGEDKIKTETSDHRPLLVRTKLPEICQLKIPLGEGEETMSKEERLALMRACYGLRRIQRAAANEAYFARQIFNRTDPLSDCFFVKNCRTSCKLRFGEINYTIGWRDLAKMFLPAGWVLFIGKIINIARKVNTVYNVFNEIKNTARSGIKLLNDFLKETSYLATFYRSIQRIVKLVGNDGMSGFSKMFDDYSKNLLAYSQAKNESIGLTKKTMAESAKLIDLLEKIKGVKSITEKDSTEKEKLDAIIYPYLGKLMSLKDYLADISYRNSKIKSVPTGNKTTAYNVSCRAAKYCNLVRAYIDGKDVAVSNNVLDTYANGYHYHVFRKLGDNFYTIMVNDGTYSKINCPSNNKFLEEDFNVSTKKAPELTITLKPGEICDVACISPNCSNSNCSNSNNWFTNISEIYNLGSQLENMVDDYLDCLNDTSSQGDELSCRNDNLIPEATTTQKEISIKQQELLNYTNMLPESGGKKLFWQISTSTGHVYDNYDDSNGVCFYDSQLYYSDWQEDISKTSSFDLLSVEKPLEELEKEYQFAVDSSGEIKELLSTPLISVKIIVSISNIQEILKNLAANNSGTNEAKDLTSKLNLLEQKLDLIKNNLKEIENTWQKEDPASGHNASSYINKIIKTKNNSLNIASVIKEINTPPLIISQIKQDIESVFSSDPDKNKYINNMEETENVISAIDNIVGSYKQGGKGFLGEIYSFENIEIDKSFEELKTFIDVFISIQDIIQEIDSLGKNIVKLKPTLNIVPAKAEDMKTFDDFKEGLTKNPLDYLEETIAEIKSEIQDIITRFNRLQQLLANKKGALDAKDRAAAENVINKVIEIKAKWLNMLRVSIFGNKEINFGCENLALLLNKGYQEAEASCQEIKNDYSNIRPLEETCQKQKGIISFLEENDIPGFSGANSKFEQFCNLNLSDPKQWWLDNVCKTTAAEQNEEDRYDEFTGSPPPAGENNDCMTFADDINDSQLIKDVCNPDVVAKCQRWWEIKEPKKMCDKYDNIVFPALQNKCGNSSQKTECQMFRDFIPPLGSETASLKSFFNYLCNKSLISDCSGAIWQNGVPDLTKTGAESEKLTNEIKLACISGKSNVLEPLKGIMNVYAFLLGIKSGTLFYKGVKTSYIDAKIAYQNAQKTINMIKQLPEKLKSGNGNGGGESGLSIKPIKCVAEPALGYKKQSGPMGGPVCPDVQQLFSVIESNFDIIRQNLNEIDLRRRKLGLKDIIRIFGGAMVPKISKRLEAMGYGIKYKSINPIYDEALSIRNRARNLWALGTALSFADKSCTCGKSFCRFPVCVSGVPLTLAPIKNPYCYLVYILRYPFRKQLKTLENYLK